jgi:predicted Zn finger-like uncharacterized protein
MLMRVRCPSCQTVFRLPPGALEVADGLVRCGRCEATFDGSQELEPDEEEIPEIVVLHDAVDAPPVPPAMMLDPDAVLDPRRRRRPPGSTRDDAGPGCRARGRRRRPFQPDRGNR